VLLGTVLPFSPLANILGFTPLPGSYFIFLGASIVTYLLLVEIMKRQLFGKVEAHPIFPHDVSQAT